MADNVNDQSTTPPVIEFPCHNYPVKIMGEASDTFFEFVLATTEVYAPNFDRNKVALKQSSKAKFSSVTVFITATGAKQLEEYHQALKANTAVKIVL